MYIYIYIYIYIIYVYIYIYTYIIHLKQRYLFSKIQLTTSKTKNVKNSNPINLIFQGVVLEGA